MKRIAIVGGGITGLVAARKLVQSGHHVTVYESGAELGGLAASFQMAGCPLEKAYHHLFRTDTDILTLVNELALDDSLEWKASSVAIYRNGRIWPFMSPLDLLRFGACSWVGRIRTGMAVLYLKKTRNWKKLARVSALDWMQNACGSSATRAIWGPLLRGKFSAHADKVSMAWLWARLHIRANSREPGGGGEKLGYFRGGFIKVTRALEKELLDGGATLHLSKPILALGHDGTNPTVDSGTGALPFDAVLFSGSSIAFERLIPKEPSLQPYRDQLRSIKYLGAVCYVFSSSQSLGNSYWLNVNEDDAPFLVFIEHTNLMPSSHYNGKHVYYIGAYLPVDSKRFLMPKDDLIHEWQGYLKRIFPNFEPQQIDESYLFHFKDAQHIVDLGYEDRIPSYETPLAGVFLSNFTQIFPEDRGTNYAVREGNKVGARILDFLKI
jgi:protoporphyrinogen oxidase